MQTPITYSKLKDVTNVNSIENPSAFKYIYKQFTDTCTTLGCYFMLVLLVTKETCILMLISVLLFQ